MVLFDLVQMEKTSTRTPKILLSKMFEFKFEDDKEKINRLKKILPKEKFIEFVSMTKFYSRFGTEYVIKGFDFIERNFKNCGVEDFAFIGGVAYAALIQPRTTKDVDVIVQCSEESVEYLLETAKKEGFEVDVSRFDGVIFFATIKEKDGNNILDIVFALSEWHMEVMQRAEILEIEGEKIKIISPEDLLIFKLLAWRKRDFSDIEHILAFGVDKKYILKWIGKFTPYNPYLFARFENAEKGVYP